MSTIYKHTSKDIPMFRRIATLSALSLSLVITGCSLNDDDKKSASPAPADYRVVDLVTGTITSYGTSYGDRIADPTDTEYIAARTQRMVFKRVNGLYVAVFETTQAQWNLIASEKPVSDILLQDNNRPGNGTYAAAPALPALAFEGSVPVYGVSLTMALDGIDSFSTKYPAIKLDLPTQDEWVLGADDPTVAAIPPSTTPTTGGWSTVSTASDALGYALVKEEIRSTPGPIVVGSRTAISGLYDMHGNVRELTKDGYAYGGSWFDSWEDCSATSYVQVSTGAAHMLSGMRLLLR